MGICLGHQILATVLGGKVEKSTNPEIGFTIIKHKNSHIFKNVEQNFLAYEFHFDDVICLPKNIEILAMDSMFIVQLFKVLNRNLFGVQFHPKVKLLYAVSKFTENSDLIKPININSDNIINAAKTEYDDRIPQKIINNFLELCNLC